MFLALPGGLAFIMYLLFFRDNRNNIFSGLFIEKYEIDRKNPARIIHLKGRKAGLWGWIFNMMNIGMSYEIEISARDVQISESGMFTKGQTFLPMSQIITTRYGYRRPKFALFVALFFAIWGFTSIPGIAPSTTTSFNQTISSGSWAGAVVLMLIAGAIFWFGYLNQRSIEIRFSTGDGLFWGYAYNIGADGDIEQARETSQILNEIIQRVSRGEDYMILDNTA